MPPRVPLALKTRPTAPAGTSSPDVFFCPLCSLWRLTRPSARSRPFARLHSTRLLPSSSIQASTRISASPRRLLSSAPSDRTLRPLPPAHQHLQASSLASNTAINPPLHIPPPYHALHASLERLQHSAGDYVNQSRLQLALRGLETQKPTIRVGLLGLGRGGEDAARRLARVLLADPLGVEEAWERKLAGMGHGSGKALLLRYGAEDDLPPQNPLLETMYIPSRILGRNNLEILITSLNSSSGPHGEADPAGLLEAVLVPPLQTPIGFTGRAGFVRNPVHKALIVGDGIEGSLEFGRFEGLLNGTLQGSEVEDDLGQVIKAAINIPRDPTRTLQQIAQYGGVAAVDIEQASAGLELFRKDITNGPEFNAKWQVSNVQGLTSWLTAGSQASFMDTASISQSLHPAISAHVTSILRSASTAIAQSEIVARDSVNSATIPDTTRTYLQAAITNWSQHAHTDLQFSLARATSSRAWRRTSWNRLLWRADDVGVAAEEVLRSYWLLDAEMGLAFLSGRVEEAGFFRNTGGLNNFNPDWVLSQSDRVLGEDGKPVASERSYLAGPGKTAADEEVKEARKGRHWFFGNWLEKVPREPTAPELFRADRMLNRVQQEGGVDLRHSRPWPLAIHYTRQKLLYTLVPTLQRRAQSLVLQSFSTVGATSALGAWIFVVTGGIGIYEAGAVAALGLVWSLRRLQRKWEEARNVWEGEVRESGRVVLSDVEATLRVVIAGNERPVLRTEDVVAWRKARDAVQQVGEELGKLK